MGVLGSTSPTLPSQGRRPWTSFQAKDVASLSREGSLTFDHTVPHSVFGLRDSVLQGRNSLGWSGSSIIVTSRSKRKEYHSFEDMEDTLRPSFVAALIRSKNGLL